MAWHQMISVTSHDRINFWVYEHPFNGNVDRSHGLRLYSLSRSVDNELTRSDLLAFTREFTPHLDEGLLARDDKGHIFLTSSKNNVIYIWSNDGYYKGLTHTTNFRVSRATATVFDKKRDSFYIVRETSGLPHLVDIYMITPTKL